MQRRYGPVHFGNARLENLQECTDNTTGVVLAPKVQRGPYQLLSPINCPDVFALFATPSGSQVPILQL